MKLSVEQINELITGCKLAVELKPTEPGLRHFMTVWGYEISAEGRFKELSRTICSKKMKNTYFQIRDYEIPKEYYYNGLEISDLILKNDRITNGIVGIFNLEKELDHYFSDPELLMPEWRCDNLI